MVEEEGRKELVVSFEEKGERKETVDGKKNQKLNKDPPKPSNSSKNLEIMGQAPGLSILTISTRMMPKPIGCFRLEERRKRGEEGERERER